MMTATQFSILDFQLPKFENRHSQIENLLGGGERVRTDDLLRARQALSQLSYTPNKAAERIAHEA